MRDIVKMFDYCAFHDDGHVQFFQITEGQLTDYREYARPEDAPVMRVDLFEGIAPPRDLRYHGRSYKRNEL